MARHQKFFYKPSLTKQCFKQECDVNVIVKRFRDVNGVDLSRIPANALGGSYGDFFDAVDYRTAQDQILQGRALFDALPERIRSRFGFDPGALADFMQDPANAEEAVRLGLRKQPDSVDSSSNPSDVV